MTNANTKNLNIAPKNNDPRKNGANNTNMAITIRKHEYIKRHFNEKSNISEAMMYDCKGITTKNDAAKKRLEKNESFILIFTESVRLIFDNTNLITISGKILI